MRGGGRAALFGGLLSGTSLDGIDAVLLEVAGPGPSPEAWRIRAFATSPWEEGLLQRMRRALAPGGADGSELAALHVAVAESFARAFRDLLAGVGVAAEEVEALGSHGQTFWHEPPVAGDRRGWTLQLGDPATLAERTGIPVVSDFRARDMAAGGHGAPLVPWADLQLLHRPGTGRAIQNLGGMGNVTWLPRSGDPARVLAFDTGPGVALLDGAARRASGGRDPWDLDGQRAARGTVDEALLDSLLSDPFFQEPPPRSTGRERFGEPRLEAIVQDFAGSRGGIEITPSQWDDLLATLTELTARSVALAYRDHLPLDEVDEVVLAGGGARNPTLVARLEAAMAALGSPVPRVLTGAEALGIDPDAREVAAFALLAWAHLRAVPGNLPMATGARGSRVLGSLTPGADPRHTPGGPGGEGA